MKAITYMNTTVLEPPGILDRPLKHTTRATQYERPVRFVKSISHAQAIN